jgi:hypothetical protein
MSVVAAIREMLAKGVALDDALDVVEAFEAQLEPPTARQARNQRYYQARKERLKERLKASELRRPPDKTVKTPEASESVLIKTALARVEDNLLPLEIAGGFQEEGVSQVSNETFETLVPETKIKTRKQNVELFQTIVGMWNEMASGLRLVAVRDITPTRQAAIVARSEDLVKTYDFPDPIAGWRKLMGFVRGSPFLRGELNGFRCDFDFVTRASSFTKIMEGKYEARPSIRR